eukprot:NODE_226_length_12301_cov_1.446648.p9 type:complete len:120 gc:universal NODE_226_length_12301_cov_1.446648:10526-10885(+)
MVIIFVQKRPSYLLWLFVYTVCSYPIHGLYLPVYSFWHFDDFSWGNTRQVSAKQVKEENEKENEEILRRLPQGTIADYQQQDGRLDEDEEQDWNGILKSKNPQYNSNENLKGTGKYNGQ